MCKGITPDNSPLNQALLSGQGLVVNEILLKKKESPVWGKGKRAGSFHFAVHAPNRLKPALIIGDLLEQLHTHGLYDLNDTMENGETPLIHAAAFEENTYPVEVLLKLGADPLRKCNKGNTALNMAIFAYCESVATALISFEPRLALEKDSSDTEPLFYALQLLNDTLVNSNASIAAKIATALLAAGANPLQKRGNVVIDAEKVGLDKGFLDLHITAQDAKKGAFSL